MPDWTYIPLSPIASAVLGERRTQITAMRLLAGLIDHFGGRRWIPWVFGHPPIPPQLMGRFGASAQLSICKSLLAFMAHDRAGFGGALIGAGLAVLLISLWGWRRGQRWVWWSLLAGCAFGTAPTLTIHLAIGYIHLEHLLPVYVRIAVTAAALILSPPYLTAPAELTAQRDGKRFEPARASRGSCWTAASP